MKADNSDWSFTMAVYENIFLVFKVSGKTITVTNKLKVDNNILNT